MRLFMEHYGSFIVEAISGIAVIGFIATFIWPKIQETMTVVVGMLT